MNYIIYLIIIILVITCILLNNNYELFDSMSNDYVCLYAYYEKNKQYKENLEMFLKKGILDEIDYYIIINGECTVNIPDRKNIKIINRPNQGYDFGAWSHCINHYINNEYKYYIFINSSVRGPFLKNPNKKWIHKFIKLFNTKDVKLVGTTINILEHDVVGNERFHTLFNKPPPYTHVQSMFFILDNDAFHFLLNKKFFNDEKTLNKIKDFDTNILNNNIILYKEIGMSQLILNNNWNINCILSKYRNYDYRKIKKNFNPSSDDPYYKNKYFGKTIKPNDVIFFKINRF
jgi:hypothetical protein